MIKRLCSDRGTEYDSISFNIFYKQHGIVHEKTAPYSPGMNGKVERKNRTLTELVIAIMLNTSVASHWWGKFLLIVCYIPNRVSKYKNKISPCEILKKRQPGMSYFRTWGCLTYVRISDSKRVKIASRAYKCVLIRYATNSKAYMCHDLNAKLIIESKDFESMKTNFLSNWEIMGALN